VLALPTTQKYTHVSIFTKRYVNTFNDRDNHTFK
jgi:hypothetical protein